MTLEKLSLDEQKSSIKANDSQTNLGGVCLNCGQTSRSNTWCKLCDPEIYAQGWSSGNKVIDDLIKESIRSASNWHDPFLEWIPYNRLANLKKIGEGGFGVVYSAEWLDGDRSWEFIEKKRQPCLVAVKQLKGAQYLPEFFKEVS